jgi:transposase
VACTDTLTAYHLHAYHLHPSRGRAAVTEFDVLPAFRGTVVHDALSVYDAYPGARHALCGAHISRELVAAGEADPDQTWPAQALRALHGLNTAAHHARDQQLPAIPPETAQPLLDSWRHALLVGLAEHRRAPGRRQSKTRNLLERLRDRDTQVLLFARHLTVPFTNNQAERDVRPTKIQQRTSGGSWRTLAGLADFAVVQSCLSTAGKWGLDSLDVLTKLFTTGPWLPPAAQPS